MPVIDVVVLRYCSISPWQTTLLCRGVLSSGVLGARKLHFLAVQCIYMSGRPWQSDFAAHLARRAWGCRCPA